MDIVFIIGRVLLGLFFIMTGMNHFSKFKKMVMYATSKNIPLPAFSVIITGAMLFVGGLGVIVWTVLLPVALLLLALVLLLSALFMHNFWKVKDPQQKMVEMMNFMKNMALLGALLIMAGMIYGFGV